MVARAHASKTTVYRRWPSKAELVCAAFAYRICGQHALPPDTGSLRGDLLALAAIISDDAGEYGRTIAGILTAGERSPRLRELLVNDLSKDRRNQAQGVLRRAMDRGEIVPDVISDDLGYLLPAYITFRALQHKRPVPPTPCARSSTKSRCPASPASPRPRRRQSTAVSSHVAPPPPNDTGEAAARRNRPRCAS